MPERRRYTKREKAVAVTAALASSTLRAAEESGIPESTLRQWVHSPEYAELRDKTREEIAQDSIVLSQLAMGAIRAKLPEFEPRDLVVLWGVLIDKSQLLSGAATSRSEHRDITADLDDHERTTLHEAIRQELAKREEVA